MKFEKFTVKDIIFLAILSAVLMLVAGATMPLVMYNKLLSKFSTMDKVELRKVNKLVYDENNVLLNITNIKRR